MRLLENSLEEGARRALGLAANVGVLLHGDRAVVLAFIIARRRRGDPLLLGRIVGDARELERRLRRRNLARLAVQEVGILKRLTIANRLRGFLHVALPRVVLALSGLVLDVARILTTLRDRQRCRRLGERVVAANNRRDRVGEGTVTVTSV